MTKKAWNKEVEEKINTLNSVLPWLKNIADDPDKDFEWESQKSAHQAMKYIELAMYEMWNLQYYTSKNQQKLAKQALEELSQDTD